VFHQFAQTVQKGHGFEHWTVDLQVCARVCALQQALQNKWSYSLFMPATGGGKKDAKGKESKKDVKQSAKKRESEVFLEGTFEVKRDRERERERVSLSLCVCVCV